MTGPGATAYGDMTCDEVSELAGLYVLDALETSEKSAVVAHLATCTEAHEEVRELGAVVPALASSMEPIDAPPALKARVLAAVRSEAGTLGATVETRAGAVRPWAVTAPPSSVPPSSRRWKPPAWATFGSALAALLIVAVTGVWALGALQRVERAELRAQVLAEAIAAFSAPGSATAVLRGTGADVDASGFAALTPDGKGYLVMVGLDAAPQGQTYQAWYIAEGQPASAGVLSVDEDGYAVLVGGEPLPGTKLVALTREPVGGSLLPTTEPFAAGEVRPPA